MSTNYILLILLGGWVALCIFTAIFGLIYMKLSSRGTDKPEVHAHQELQAKIKAIEDGLKLAKQQVYSKEDSLQALKNEIKKEIDENSREIKSLKEKVERISFELLLPRKGEKVEPPASHTPFVPPTPPKVASAPELAKIEEPRKEEKPYTKPNDNSVDDIIALLQKKHARP